MKERAEEDLVIATLSGKSFTDIPSDLFIPPDALELLLDSFTGPFDLLLYLIRHQNIDIMDIPIALITEQYMHYIQLMEESRFELAAEYLAMAAMLAEIKSRLLLPKAPNLDEEIEEDPRLALVEKLQRYEQFKYAALAIDNLPRLERDTFRFSLKPQALEPVILQPEVALSTLIHVMDELIKRQGHSIGHQIIKEALSVKERMLIVLEKLQNKSMLFSQLVILKEGRTGVVVTLLAILELARQSLVFINQTTEFAPIRLEVIS
ncbi:segregation and condensation protein A [Legionella beliardensis]|uniref:Segregation and condensation protein A n=1 Tax=Legionella beliardensis TaxID=91822 RepID=A0A378I2A9_9GAMM|nr:segregation/condensation protein A [Legionella beliardensis]STX28786.1 segregation and condensation protein A [Legionella beliardensis]